MIAVCTNTQNERGSRVLIMHAGGVKYRQVLAVQDVIIKMSVGYFTTVSSLFDRG